MASQTFALPRGLCARLLLAAGGFLALLAALPCDAADPPPFHQAPAAAAQRANPYQGPAAAAAGRELYAANCSGCHGGNAQGSGNIPALAHSRVQLATDGEVFWFITKGSNNHAMPSWAAMPEQQRWQIVSYLKTLSEATAADGAAADRR